MNTLKDTWLTDDVSDFEYKKYILLAYLQRVSKEFNSVKLYPHLAELIHHYQNLYHYINSKKLLASAFPKDLSSINLEDFKLNYTRTAENNIIMAEIEKILEFSVPAIRKHLDEGKEIYDWVEAQLKLNPIGLEPIDQNFGYVFIRNGNEAEARVYEYNLSLITHADGNYRTIYTQYINSYKLSISSTFENIKAKLLKSKNLFIMPAVFALESEHQLPFDESLLPVAKRMLMLRLTK
ncbi:MAG: hypothetical protein NTX03_01625 [Bacteroidetes bacterium]|nr:hypothetical protein [Bacteroidota bacterium]